jgi:ATP-dependent protease HslVU (ClpYQ) peptidase subunit
MADSGLLENDKGQESFDFMFLMGYRGKLYTVGGDGSVVHSDRPFHSIGSGGEVAIGYLHALFDSNTDLSPKKMIKKAIKAASMTSQGVNDRVTVLKLATEQYN